MNYLLVFSGLGLLYTFVIWRTGKSFPLLEMFLFTYYLQYIFATLLSYNDYKGLSSQMAISQGRYLDYALPALAALFAGIVVFNKAIDIRPLVRSINERYAEYYGLTLVAVSYVLDLVGYIGIESLSSIIYFTTQLKYLGAFALIFTPSLRNKAIVVFVFIQLAIQVLQGGVFITFFVWSTYLFFVLCLRYRLPLAVRFTFIFVAAPVLILIQSIKQEYREVTWQQGKEGGVGLINDLAKKQQSPSFIQVPFTKSEGVIETVGRLSQGWHLGMTLKRVPAIQPFVDGEEMASDITAALIPRLLISDKKTVHSHDKFYKYTGWTLRNNTSMTIGILGDFYINFGRTGSFILLFVFGALISLFVVYFTRRFVLRNPINFIWIPFILNYLIRADNDFYIVFNCAVKGFLIFLAFDYFFNKFLKMPRIIAK